MTTAAGARLAEQLTDFRRNYPPRTIEVEGRSWRYICAGSGDKSLLMLPGALGSAELGFQLIDWWAPRMKIVTPYYIAGRSIAETQTVLERILDAEGIDKTSVLGSSFGGTLAQSWTRAHPERTERMVLSHTIAPDPRYQRRIALYPSARVHTFQGSGHASAIVDAHRYAEIVAEFLSGRFATTRTPALERVSG